MVAVEVRVRELLPMGTTVRLQLAVQRHLQAGEAAEAGLALQVMVPTVQPRVAVAAGRCQHHQLVGLGEPVVMGRF
jgi:hypothetical protein